MHTQRTFMIAAGLALWVPLLCSFFGGLSVARVSGLAVTQVAMVGLLIAATLLLGVLIGKTAAVPVNARGR